MYQVKIVIAVNLIMNINVLLTSNNSYDTYLYLKITKHKQLVFTSYDNCQPKKA